MSLTKKENSEFEFLIKKWINHFKYLGSEKYKAKKKFRLNQEKFQNSYAIELINKFNLRDKSVLEVGCGMGGLLAALQINGVKSIEAVEFNEEYCKISKLRSKKYGLSPKISNGMIENFNSRKKFDFIIINDVLEHVQDPVACLNKIHSLLKPKGEVYIIVINRYCLIDPHYHLYFINFLPRKIGNWIVNILSSKENSLFKDNQDLVDMHYYTKQQFRSLCKKIGFNEVLLLEKRRLIDKVSFDILKTNWKFVLRK